MSASRVWIFTEPRSIVNCDSYDGAPSHICFTQEKADAILRQYPITGIELLPKRQQERTGRTQAVPFRDWPPSRNITCAVYDIQEDGSLIDVTDSVKPDPELDEAHRIWEDYRRQ